VGVLASLDHASRLSVTYRHQLARSAASPLSYGHKRAALSATRPAARPSSAARWLQDRRRASPCSERAPGRPPVPASGASGRSRCPRIRRERIRGWDSVSGARSARRRGRGAESVFAADTNGANPLPGTPIRPARSPIGPPHAEDVELGGRPPHGAWCGVRTPPRSR